MRLSDLKDLLRLTFAEWIEDKAPRVAAALAYYTVFSLAPLLVLTIAIAGLVIGDDRQLQQQVTATAASVFGPDAAELLSGAIESSAVQGRSPWATALGFIVLAIGATGVFGQLKEALNTMWDVPPGEKKGFLGTIKDRFMSLTLVAGTSFLLLVSLLISTALAFLNEYLSGVLGEFAVVAQVLNLVVSLAVVTLVFAIMFKVLPDVVVPWRDVWLGAFITAVLFTAGKELISLYLGRSSTASVYGAAGSLVVILAWVYYSAQILFLGAEFTQVYWHRREGRPFGAATLGGEAACSASAEGHAASGS